MAKAEFLGYRARSRDIQDGFERHVWGKQRYGDTGALISVRGTGTIDEDAPVVNMGYSFNLPDNSNTEVMLVSMGSDTNQKMALTTIPRDKQRHWPPGSGGIQHPTNPDFYCEFNDDGIVLRHGRVTIGNDDSFYIEVSEGEMKINGDLRVSGNIIVEGDRVEHKGTNIGYDHRHGGVENGIGLTEDPQ